MAAGRVFIVYILTCFIADLVLCLLKLQNNNLRPIYYYFTLTHGVVATVAFRETGTHKLGGSAVQSNLFA